MSNLFDKKSIVTVLVVQIVMSSLASVIIVHEVFGNDSKVSGTYNIIARANSEGSGIYITPEAKEQGEAAGGFFEIDGEGNYTITEANKAAWAGKIVGTPGVGTIQHVQMQQIAEKAGLKFTLYQEGQTPELDSVYFIGGLNTADLVLENQYVQIGMLWEPQFQKIIASDKFEQLALSGDIFPGHTCCIVVGSQNFMKTHKDVTERFLVAYMVGMKWVQDALDPASQNYNKLVQIASETTGIKDENIVKQALAGIKYIGIDDDSTLTKLKKDIADLTDQLEEMGTLKNKLSDLGFNYSSQFANRFVDDTYLISATKRMQSGEEITGQHTTLSVGVITGDVHQIAIHVANSKDVSDDGKSFFEKVNLTVNLAGATNGPGVAVAMQNGTTQFALMGAPPATSTTINSKLITA